MINFSREDKDVVVRVDSETNVEKRLWPFSHTCVDEDTAEIVMRRFRNNLRERMEAIRLRAYNAGWRDAKAKVKKKTSFIPTLRDNQEYIGF